MRRLLLCRDVPRRALRPFRGGLARGALVHPYRPVQRLRQPDPAGRRDPRRGTQRGAGAVAVTASSAPTAPRRVLATRNAKWARTLAWRLRAAPMDRVVLLSDRAWRRRFSRGPRRCRATGVARWQSVHRHRRDAARILLSRCGNGVLDPLRLSRRRPAGRDGASEGRRQQGSGGARNWRRSGAPPRGRPPIPHRHRPRLRRRPVLMDGRGRLRKCWRFVPDGRPDERAQVPGRGRGRRDESGCSGFKSS